MKITPQKLDVLLCANRKTAMRDANEIKMETEFICKKKKKINKLPIFLLSKIFFFF